MIYKIIFFVVTAFVTLLNAQTTIAVSIMPQKALADAIGAIKSIRLL